MNNNINKIVVSLAKQEMYLFDANDDLIKTYQVSTAANGAGEERGSYQTPRGQHIIRAKIGKDCPENTVFVARRATGEIFCEEMKTQFPLRDWILTRILWLSGCELGRNRLGSCDTMRRYIYIHGTPDSTKLGEIGSHGCIRMKNSDIIELFDLVKVYATVEIIE